MNQTKSNGTQVVKLWMDLEQLIMFTFEALYYWDFMTQKLFYFPPERRKTKELVHIDFPLSAQTESSMDLLDIPPVKM